MRFIGTWHGCWTVLPFVKTRSLSPRVKSSGSQGLDKSIGKLRSSVGTTWVHTPLQRFPSLVCLGACQYEVTKRLDKPTNK